MTLFDGMYRRIVADRGYARDLLIAEATCEECRRLSGRMVADSACSPNVCPLKCVEAAIARLNGEVER